jgi:DnaJ-class molecular chaperone
MAVVPLIQRENFISFFSMVYTCTVCAGDGQHYEAFSDGGAGYEMQSTGDPCHYCKGLGTVTHK